MKQLKMAGVKHKLRVQHPESQAREPVLGKKPESFGQSESNEEANTVMEKGSLQDSQT